MVNDDIVRVGVAIVPNVIPAPVCSMAWACTNGTLMEQLESTASWVFFLCKAYVLFKTLIEMRAELMSDAFEKLRGAHALTLACFHQCRQNKE